MRDARHNNEFRHFQGSARIGLSLWHSHFSNVGQEVFRPSGFCHRARCNDGSGGSSARGRESSENSRRRGLSWLQLAVSKATRAGRILPKSRQDGVLPLSRRKSGDFPRCSPVDPSTSGSSANRPPDLGGAVFVRWASPIAMRRTLCCQISIKSCDWPCRSLARRLRWSSKRAGAPTRTDT